MYTIMQEIYVRIFIYAKYVEKIGMFLKGKKKGKRKRARDVKDEE